MLIPWNTDAPIYHFPWATLGLIGINTAVFAALLATQGEGFEDYVLVYGDGLHPVQWVSSAFLHGGFGHLIGNMVFLWVFGLIVEGKLGWWKFLLIYFGLGIVQNAAEQSMSFWFAEGGSIGASAIIYGLMAMALVWAPENEVSCLLFVGLRPFTFEIRIFWLAIFYIGTDVLMVWLSGFEVRSELFHSFGAVLGAALGFLFLKLDWVDCEGWDLPTVMSGRHLRSGGERRVTRTRSAPAKASSTKEDEPSTAADRFIRQQEKFRTLLAEKKGQAALAAYEKAVQYGGTWELPEPDLIKLGDLLCTQKLFNEAVPFLENYIARFEKRAHVARLRLVQILVDVQKRPSYALRVLADLPAGSLKPEYEKLRLALTQKAEKMVADGVMELEGRAW